MKRLLLLCLLAAPAYGQIPFSDDWDHDLASPQAHDITIFRGETKYLRPRYLNDGTDVTVTGASISLYYKPSMVSTATWMYATTGSVVSASRVSVTWGPTLEAPYSQYDYNIVASNASGASWSANGKINLRGTVAGTSTNAPGQVVWVYNPGDILRLPSLGWQAGYVLMSSDGTTNIFWSSVSNAVVASNVSYATQAGVASNIYRTGVSTPGASLALLTDLSTATNTAVIDATNRVAGVGYLLPASTSTLATVTQLNTATNAAVVDATNRVASVGYLLPASTSTLATVTQLNTATNAAVVDATNRVANVGYLLPASTSTLATVTQLNTATNAAVIDATNRVASVGYLLPASTSTLATVTQLNTATNEAVIDATNRVAGVGYLLPASTSTLATVTQVNTATNEAVIDATNRVAGVGYLLPASTGTIAGATVTGVVPASSWAAKAESASNIFTSAWRLAYSDGSTNMIELALGLNNTYLRSSGTDSPPGFGAITATATNVGLTNIVGTMTNNYIPMGNGTSLVLQPPDAVFAAVCTNIALTNIVGTMTNNYIPMGNGTKLALQPPATVLTALSTNIVFDTNLLAKILAVDGAGSGVDADLLDGFTSADLFNTSTNMFAGSGTTGRVSSAAGDAGKYLRADATWVDVLALIAAAAQGSTNYTDGATNALRQWVVDQGYGAGGISGGTATTIVHNVTDPAFLATTNYTDGATNALDTALRIAIYNAANANTNYTDGATNTLDIALRANTAASTQTIAGASVVGTVPAAQSAYQSTYATGLNYLLAGKTYDMITNDSFQAIYSFLFNAEPANPVQMAVEAQTAVSAQNAASSDYATTAGSATEAGHATDSDKLANLTAATYITNKQPNAILGGTLTPTNTLTVTNSLQLANIPAASYLTNNHANASMSGTLAVTNLTVSGVQTNLGSLTVLGGGNVITNNAPLLTSLSNTVFAATNEFIGGWYSIGNSVTSLLARVNEPLIVTQLVAWADSGACTAQLFASTYWSNRVTGATTPVAIPVSSTGSLVNCSFNIPAGGGLWQISCTSATNSTNVVVQARAVPQ